MLFPNKTASLTYRETTAFRELSGAFLTPAPWVQPTSRDSLYFATLPLLPVSESQKQGAEGPSGDMWATSLALPPGAQGTHPAPGGFPES